MNIAQLQPKQGKVELTAKVKSVEEPRSFNREGNTGMVCNAVLQDETGEIKLTLWNEQVEQVRVGDIIKITNGYVGEWRGELQLSTGKFGSLEVVEGGNTQERTSSEQILDEEEIE